MLKVTITRDVVIPITLKNYRQAVVLLTCSLVIRLGQIYAFCAEFYAHLMHSCFERVCLSRALYRTPSFCAAQRFQSSGFWRSAL